MAILPVLFCLWSYGACLPASYFMTAGENTTTGTDARGSGVQFTRPDGTPIYVNPRAVAFVRAALHDEHGKATIVFTSGAKQQVMETVEEVIHGIHLDMPRGAQ